MTVLQNLQPQPPLVVGPPPPTVKSVRFKQRAATRGVTVHCSASRPSQDWDARTVDRVHRQIGFLCIGYHFVIKRDGTVEAGRPMSAEGGHARDGNRNRTHIGVCLIGGISEKPQRHTPGNPWNGSDAEMNFTPPQFASLTRLLAHLNEQYETNLPVEGHRDVPGSNKACPSFQVGRWLQTGEAIL